VPTLITHPAVPLALGLVLGREAIPARLLLAGVVASVLPDLDVVAFRLGVPYAAEFGLTPSARARLAIDPGRGKKSKFEGLIGGKTKK